MERPLLSSIYVLIFVALTAFGEPILAEDTELALSGAERRLSKDYLRVYINKADVKKATFDTGGGISFQVDFYINNDDKKPAGTWFATETETKKKDACIGHAILAFNKNTAITLMYACDQRLDPITGGSGMYPCARGQAEFEDKPGKYYFAMNIYSGCN